ncbi:MAG: hypothetical protein VKJ04_01875 [Vampirovibrionales bacterium]|nr:hypothetical protein [Vampirovibrionales bacterium]
MSNPFDRAAGHPAANAMNAQGAYPISPAGYPQGDYLAPPQPQYPTLQQFSSMQGASGMDGFMTNGSMPFPGSGGGGGFGNIPISASVLDTVSYISSSMAVVMQQLGDVTNILGNALAGDQGAGQTGTGAGPGAQGTPGAENQELPQVSVDVDQELAAQGFTALTATDVEYEIPAAAGEEPELDSVTVFEAADLDENGALDTNELTTFKSVIEGAEAPAELSPEKKAQLEAAADVFKDEMGSRSNAKNFIDDASSRKNFQLFSAAGDTEEGISEDDATYLAEGLHGTDVNSLAGGILQNHGVERISDLRDELDPVEVDDPEAEEIPESEAGEVPEHEAPAAVEDLAATLDQRSHQLRPEEIQHLDFNTFFTGEPVDYQRAHRMFSNLDLSSLSEGQKDQVALKFVSQARDNWDDHQGPGATTNLEDDAFNNHDINVLARLAREYGNTDIADRLASFGESYGSNSSDIISAAGNDPTWRGAWIHGQSIEREEFSTVSNRLGEENITLSELSEQ